MDEIKSAMDIARSRIEDAGEATESDRLRWKYTPEGEKLAAAQLEESRDLVAELSRFPAEAMPYLKKGLESTLEAAIALPRNEAAQARNKRALDGLLAIKKDKSAAVKIISQMRQVLEHYGDQGAKQRQVTREALKNQHEARLKQVMDKQLGAGGLEGVKINAESLPQFQEEWRRVSAQMDQQYLKLLDEFKKELAKIN